jgi:hypothetical protein
MKPLIFAILPIFLLSGPSFAAQNCPATAAKASFELWPAGQLGFGETRTGTHPCGRSLTCIGGNTHRGVQRTCKWS